MKVEAQLNNLRMTPRKVRLVAYSIRGMAAGEALVQLAKQVKKSSLPLEKLLKSAIANAENNFGMKQEDLYVADVTVGDGQRLKRWMPRAHGRATMILKRMCRVRLILEAREGASRKKKSVKKLQEEENKPETEVSEVKKAPVRKATPARKAVSQVKNTRPVAGGKKVFQRKAV